MHFSNDFIACKSSLSQPHLSRIEVKMREAIKNLGKKSPLRDACEYALMSGGKRLRPLLVLLVAEGVGKKRDVISAALSVEFFHTASLIADDLPCMDNGEVRRGRPSLHKVFGEGVALLASYTLVSAGYGAIQATANGLKQQIADSENSIDKATACAFELVAKCAGLRGATYGQYLDLFPPDTDEKTIRMIIEHKTNTLFEISFYLGWLFGGGALDALERVSRCASHFGTAFQIADDFQDLLQDSQEGRSVNIVQSCGRAKAMELFFESMKATEQCLCSLGLWTLTFIELWESLGAMSGLEPELWKTRGDFISF